MLLALSLNRIFFLSDFLQYYGHDPSTVNTSRLLSIWKENPPDNQEQEILKNYIIGHWMYDLRFLQYLDDTFLSMTLDGIRIKIDEDGLKLKHLQALAYSQTHLNSVQHLIRLEIGHFPERRKTMIPFLDIRIPENQALLAQHFSIADINLQLRDRNPPYIESTYDILRIPMKLIHNIGLDAEEISFLKCYVVDEINTFINVDEEKEIVVLLDDIAKIDKGFAEALLIMLYQKTRIYSDAVFEALVNIGSEFAYKELINRLLAAKGKRSRSRLALHLLTHYPHKADTIAAYAYSLEDISLTKCVEQALPSIVKTPVHPPCYTPAFANNHSFEIIPNDVEINELLTNLALKMEANTFYAAVGFVYASGLSLLSPLVKYFESRQLHWELIAGSLQTSVGGGQNVKMDRNTARQINSLLTHTDLALFTYEKDFYHGKFYYLSNDNTAYVIVGSTNLSKTAFFDNRELDMMFTVNLESEEMNPFLEWYQNFRGECTPISQLEEESFADLNWDSELNAFTEQFIRTIPSNEVLRKIEALTDEQTKQRMQNWMKHNPTQILSVHNIRALENYIIFRYSGRKLAVFESFEPDNAYYVFNCEDFDLLLTQISQMSKTQMAKASMYQSKGYHIQDQQRLQSNIDHYFK